MSAAVRPVRSLLALCLALAACTRQTAPPPSPSDRPADPWARECPAAAAAPDDAWWREAIFYEVFVRSFADANGDGIGDLAGLTARLDYLNDGDPSTDDDLGVTALWLMPITESPSYHGYDVVDYRAIEKDYGTLDDWQTLVREAEARGIRIIIDLVLNHTSLAHPWFVDARSGRDAEHRAWYVWSKEPRSWSRPWGPGPTWYLAGDAWYYALFWEGMPDLNYRTEAVRAAAIDNARFWLERGAAGFRLDAVRYLIETGPDEGQSDTPETHRFWRRFRREVGAAHPDALLVGEAWTDRPDVVPYHGDGDELHMTFDFDLQSNIAIAIRMAHPEAVRDSLCDALRRFPAHAQRGTFLSNHDMTRIATQLDRDPAALRLAATLLLTLPGTPFLYYGEEIGLPNGDAPNDEAKRQPMRWTDERLAGFTTSGRAWQPPWSGKDAPSVAAQMDDPDSLLSHYRELIDLRRGHAALRSGRTEALPPAPGADTLLALLRRTEDETLLLLYNFGRDPLVDVTVTWEGRSLGPAEAGAAEPLWGAVRPALAAGGQGVRVPRLEPRSAAVVRLR